MSDRTDPAWDEFLSTGEGPTGGELEEADEEIISNEVVPGEWQQYARPKRHKEMTEAQKERNYERIRHNREKKKWERENPKTTAVIAIIKQLLTISAIVSFHLPGSERVIIETNRTSWSTSASDP